MKYFVDHQFPYTFGPIFMPPIHFWRGTQKKLNHFYLTVTKVLITTGVTKSEVIDFSTSRNAKCPSWADYPNRQRATGAFLGANLIVCGGIDDQYDKHDDLINRYKYSDECRIITQKRTKVLTNMFSKRNNAASVIIREKYLWVSGGNDGSDTLSSSEFIEFETKNGPELPTALQGHEMININDSSTLFIGGSAMNHQISSPSATYYFDHEKDQWLEGPTMQKGRRNHATGVITDKTTLKKLIVVTGGFGAFGAAGSTEILFEDVWSIGEISYHKAFYIL
jgi:hypothetical protein